MNLCLWTVNCLRVTKKVGWFNLLELLSPISDQYPPMLMPVWGENLHSKKQLDNKSLTGIKITSVVCYLRRSNSIQSRSKETVRYPAVHFNASYSIPASAGKGHPFARDAVLVPHRCWKVQLVLYGQLLWMVWEALLFHRKHIGEIPDRALRQEWMGSFTPPVWGLLWGLPKAFEAFCRRPKPKSYLRTKACRNLRRSYFGNGWFRIESNSCFSKKRQIDGFTLQSVGADVWLQTLFSPPRGKYLFTLVNF